jgi:hypothetical protein
MRTKLEKNKHNKLGLKDKIENHQNFNKKAKNKLEIKRRRPKLKNIIYAKLELRTKLKIKFFSQKNQEKKLEIKAIKIELKKIKIPHIGIEGLK